MRKATVSVPLAGIVSPPDETAEVLETLETVRLANNPFSYEQLCKLMNIRPLPPADPRDRTR